MGTRSMQPASRRRRTRRMGVAALVLAGVMVELACGSDRSELSVDADVPADRSADVDDADEAGGAGTTPERTEPTTAVSTTIAPSGVAPTSTAAMEAPGRGAGDPVALLRVAPESDGGTPYDRDAYGGWTTGSDGCRTRDTVLIRDARPPGAQVDPYGCTVLAGEWTDPYTNEAVFADDRSEVADLVHVDHVVALAEAHRSGGWRWGGALKRDFANDLDNLLATAASVNISKSDRDPASWQPPALDRWCGFTEIWILTKVRWDLTADAAEADALRNMRSARGCPDDFAGPAPAGSRSPTPPSPTTDTTADAPTPSTTSTSPTTTAAPSGCTPGYDPCIPPGDDVDCAGGSGNGPRYVEGPVHVDHAHGDPYGLDGDGDGVACT